MSLEMRSEPVRLRDKIDAALQSVQPELSPKSAFVEVWQGVQSDYEIMRQVVHQYVSRLLDEKRVRATVASRTKTLESISKSINRRDDAKHKEQKYRSPQDIFDDLHDLVGLRVVVDYPSGLDKSFHLIEENFQIEMLNCFSSDRAIGQHWKPKFGAYETRNYLLRLGSSVDLSIYAGVLFEIQITTMAESLYNKLAHPLLYKATQGGLSPKDEMIIDMGHGAALIYWITVACMEERLEEDSEEAIQTSRFPQSVRYLVGHERTAKSLDAVVHATPDLPSTSKDSISIDFLLKALADIRFSNTSEDNVWESVREKLGLDQHHVLRSLPTVPEARFDSKDLEDSPKCHEKTRQEVRHTIKNWVDDTNAETFFWLHAPAGVGKSTLARTLVDDLKHLQLAAGYFFKRGHELRNDTSHLFPTIASQLIRTIPCFAKALRLSIGTLNIESMDKISLREQFNTLIYNPLASIRYLSSNMCIIIDALDECTKPGNIRLILELLARLKEIEKFRFCVFFSSRHTRPLSNAFQRFKDNTTCREMALHEQFLDATCLEMRIVLKDGLGEIKRQQNVRQVSWPSVEDFNTILRYATSPSPLFIYTSTFLRHINGRDPNKRLLRWLERSRHSVSQLDHIYDPILKSILAGDRDDEIREPLDPDEIASLQLVLGSLILAAEPISACDLQGLLAIDEDRFRTILESLHAVVHAPANVSPINLIHKSFADYLLGIEDEATGILRIDPAQIHDQLARRCIDRMRQGLRKNICNVDNPLMMKVEREMVAKFIPPDLAYAVTHWVYHLERCQQAFDLARPFLKRHLLHWLEALSILGERALGEGGIAIRNLVTFAQKFPLNEASPGPDVLKEAQLFLNTHGLVIKEHPLQVYGVCLAREPPASEIRRLFAKSQTTRLASIESVRGGASPLPPGFREIELYTGHSLAISPDGQKIAACNAANIRIADTQTGLVLSTISLGTLWTPWGYRKAFKSPILAISFSNDQVHILGLTSNSEVFVWDTQRNEDPVCRGSLKSVSTPFERGDINEQFSIAVATRGTMVYVWNFQHGSHFGLCAIKNASSIGDSELVDGQVKDDIADVSLSVKGSTDWTIALINMYGDVFVWSAFQKASERVPCIGRHSSGWRSRYVAISPCGSLIASSDAGGVVLWKWFDENGSRIQAIKWPGDMSARSIKLFPNLKAFGVLGASTFVMPIPEQSRKGHAVWTSATEKGHRNHQIVSETLFHNSALLRPPGTMRRLLQFFPPFHLDSHFVKISRPSAVESMHLASNKRTLVTKSESHAVLVWDIETGYLQHRIPEGEKNRAISCEGSMLAVGAREGRVDLWNLQTTPATLNDSSLGPFNSAGCMEFTSDSQTLAIGDRGSLSLCNVISFQRQWVYMDDSLRGTSLKFSPNELTIVAFSTSEAYLVDAITGHCRMKVNLISSCPQVPPYLDFLNPFEDKIRHKTGHIVGDVSFSDNGRFALLYLSRAYRRKEVLAWNLDSHNISIAGPAIRHESSYIACLPMVHSSYQEINYRGHSVFPIRPSEGYVAAGNRMVLAQDDGQFTVIDFDNISIGEI